MSLEQHKQYSRMKDLIRSGETPVPALGLTLMGGETLPNVTPYAIVERPDETSRVGDNTLYLYYLDAAKKAHRIPVNEVNGLSVARGEGEYGGKLLVQFTYFRPGEHSDADETKQRQVLVGDLYYGVHPNHQKFAETEDFYFAGEDSQYAHKPQVDRQRNFPLWRLKVYGDPAAAARFHKHK
jgi:hypothetical protein